ncbi:antitoxin [Ligilactobacillus pabuli]|uniref:Antitoxin n=1 Tax=Ligilactobacillus pabuli TaxID=2886039 RepID=A0ABQ5JK34_9LACO|nr:type II toxin-antitoxin system Phd/YefM family antitoxin [Ligilactobacillus pabuli]GKS81270.1 antitoxin [Ligilactobacillus pabuli]HIW89173.1 type II toxin-antitoxin system Phd/YefM family antitoxin [Candidatus Ligilactobacillus excrementipullorum]
MEAVSYSVLRKNLRSYLQQVNDDATTLLVTNRDNADDAAVLMSKRDYDSMIETLRIMSNPTLMDKIRRGKEQITAGKTKQHELIKPND